MIGKEGNPTTSLTDVVIAPPSDKAGAYKDEDPVKGHEEDPVITMGHVQELTFKESRVKMLNPLERVFV